MRRLPIGLCGLLALLAGCPEPLPRYAALPDARAGVLAAREAAAKARDAKDLDAANRARDLAVDGLAQAEALSGTAAVASGTSDPLGDLRKAAREAKELAQETDERIRLEAQLAGFKAEAYRKVRDVAIQGSFTGLGLAARQAEQRGLDGLPPEVRDAALNAAAWADSVGGRKAKPDGSPDWAAIAADMDRLAAAPPGEIGLTLAIGFALIGKSGLSLLETEAIDPTKATDPTERLALHLLRGFVRNSNGYRRLAVIEVETGMLDMGLQRDEHGKIGAGPIALTGAEVVGGIHLLLAIIYSNEKDWRATDRELALAVAAWPENPAATFITGERLLASGEKEKAAESLEGAVKGQGEDAEWVAARMAERARAIRDGTADADGGLVGNPRFMARMAVYALWKAAERSPPAARAKAEVERARHFCADLLGRLPGSGGDGEEAGVAAVETASR